jgi:hypothetical protein
MFNINYFINNCLVSSDNFFVAGVFESYIV